MSCDDHIEKIRQEYLIPSGWERSIKEGICIDKDGDILPWYNYSVINFLKKKLNHETSVFEFGCGYSTLFFAQRSSFVRSVEIDVFWADKIKIIAAELNISNIEIQILTGEKSMEDSIDEFGQKFDLIIVDSVNRNNCIISAYHNLSKNGIIILDNSERENYRQSFDFLTNRGFKYIEFVGIGPMRYKESSTALFYREENIFEI